MFDEILRKSNDLLDKGEPFALAVVVRREAPISGKIGDKAIIQANGKIAGWIGGGCTQPVVIKEAQNAIRDGKPRLVRVTPTSSKEPLEGIVEYNMSCHSGGTIDVYIEPILPKIHLMILGKSPVGQILAQLAKVLNYRVSVFAHKVDKNSFPSVDSVSDTFHVTGQLNTLHTYLVVSTQGQDDEEALESALKLSPAYIAFIASSKKSQAVFSFLKARGITENQLQRIKVPAGLDIKAHLPEEIAVSILAEIIQIQNSAEPISKAANKEKSTIEEAIDSVCGMSVNIEDAKHQTEYNGKTYYFCCAGCKQAFEKSPEKYLKKAQESENGIDPVCGMPVKPDTAKHMSEYKGETFNFCCAGCKDKFDKQPDKYLSVTKA